MESVLPLDLNVGEFYYIEGLSEPEPNKKSRQIGKFKSITGVINNMYTVSFTNLGEIKKQNGYGRSGLHFGDGHRDSFWFTFYKIHSREYQKKIEDLYKKATNLRLQQITGDSYFSWYE